MVRGGAASVLESRRRHPVALWNCLWQRIQSLGIPRLNIRYRDVTITSCGDRPFHVAGFFRARFIL
jgi:hypothetical protein